MNQRKKQSNPPVLDDHSLAQLLQMAPERMPTLEADARIRQRLQQRVQHSASQQFFVFAHQGAWKQLAPGLQMKLLRKDQHGRAFMLKLSENTTIPYHDHASNEETFVVNGEVWLDGIRCSDGDYHYASAGTFHKEIRTEHGCTLLIKTS